MAARQRHGFKYEEMISKRDDNYILADEFSSQHDFPSGTYTSEYDLFNESTRGVRYPCRPVQAKSIGENNAVELGDLFRNSNKEEDFEFIVGFYDKIDPNTKQPNIIEEIKILVDYKKWNKQFEFEHYDDMRSWIKGVSNCYSYDSQWKEEREHWKRIWGNRLVTPTFKRDHKKQKRIQCSINQTNLKPFIAAVVKEYL